MAVRCFYSETNDERETALESEIETMKEKMERLRSEAGGWRWREAAAAGRPGRVAVRGSSAKTRFGRWEDDGVSMGKKSAPKPGPMTTGSSA